MNRKLAVSGVAVIALLGAALVVLRMQMTASGSAPRLYVPEQFKTLRESPGHLAHIHDAEVKCDECHDLQVHGFEVPDLELCKRCHEEQVSTIHAGSPLGSSAVDCQSCHTFTNDRRIQPRNCIRCHAEQQEMAKAIVTHREGHCDQCHRPHETPSLAPRTCEECHEDRAAVKHAPKAKGAQLCLDCHGVHDSKDEADTRCQTCHAAAVPKTATFDGHDKCVSCHAPHGFSRAGVRDCQSCHEDQKVLAAATVRKHSRCDDCHDEHSPGRAQARDQCEACHDRIDPNHSPDAKAGNCLGCHPAHELEKLEGKSVGCVTCHAEARSATAYHSDKTACRDCHQTHDFDIKATDSKRCGKCHADERRFSARARNGGHAKCVDCHEQAAHTPKTTPGGCNSCHEDERATAPKGHDTCGDCHSPHSGDILAEATCRSCHEEQRAGAHSRGVREDCGACHRAHGPRGPAKPPGCTDCHAPAKLTALHSVTEHQSCAGCHTPHEKRPRSDSSSCMTSACHRTIDGKPASMHEPDAKSCAGCHLFRLGKPTVPR